ncbi:hypothetical protein AB1Y20_021414 [Prymnesium parvum]|uniref:Protein DETOXIFICATION n=1 Tax=Prymnesium parvum TaxID=97485 RepID=A0AB34JI72_PRYPA
MSLVREEARATVRLAVPIVVSAVLRKAVDTVTVMYLGSLSNEALASASLATTTINVLGNSVFVGFSSATSTLVSQAYGAKDAPLTATLLARAALIQMVASVPVVLVLANLQLLLLLMGQNAELARDAQSFCAWMIPGVYAFALNFVVNPWLFSQRVTRPQYLISGVALMFHIPANHVAVYTWGMGMNGAALASSMTLVLTFLLLLATLWCSFRRRLKHMSLREAFHGWSEFLHLALPGMLMMGEWWASEIAIMMSGRLDDPDVALSAMSIYQNVNAIAFMLPWGVSTASCARIGNALGAGDASGARRTTYIGGGFAVGLSLVSTVTLLFGRHTFVRMFTHDGALQESASALLCILSLYVIADAFQYSMSAALRGSGRQLQAAPIVIVAYFFFGLPLAALLSLELGWGTVGICIGMLAGKSAHAAMTGILVLRTDWDKQVSDAQGRLARSSLAIRQVSTQSSLPLGEASQATEEVKGAEAQAVTTKNPTDTACAIHLKKGHNSEAVCGRHERAYGKLVEDPVETA